MEEIAIEIKFNVGDVYLHETNDIAFVILEEIDIVNVFKIINSSGNYALLTATELGNIVSQDRLKKYLYPKDACIEKSMEVSLKIGDEYIFINGEVIRVLEESIEHIDDNGFSKELMLIQRTDAQGEIKLSAISEIRLRHYIGIDLFQKVNSKAEEVADGQADNTNELGE